MEILRELASRLNVAPYVDVILICLAGVAVPVFVWDLREHRIPNGITVTLLLIGGLLVISLQRPHPLLVPLRLAIGLLVPLAVRRLTCKGIGMGDVRLSAGIAVLMGIRSWAIAVAVASCMFLFCFAVTEDFEDPEAGLPFGPFLLSGAILTTTARWWFPGVL